MMTNKTRLAIVDDHEIFKKAISDALTYENDFNVVFLAKNGIELLFELEKNTIDVVILDLQMPIMSGIDTLPLISNKYPTIKVVVLSMIDDPSIMIEAFNNGASAYLTKDCDIEELIEAINEVMNNKFYFTETFPHEIQKQIFGQSNRIHKQSISILSERETEILKLICTEKGSKEISEELNIAERTVQNHRYKISKKIGTSSSVGFLVYALLNGIATINAEGKVVFE